MWRILLIAEREFRAYASTASFWIALAMGPALMVLAALAMGGLTPQPAPDRVISIRTDRQEAAQVAQASLDQAAALQGLRLRLAAPGETAGPAVDIIGGEVRGAENLTRFERALLDRDLHAMKLAEQLRAVGVEPPAPPPAVSVPAPKPAAAGPPEAVGRFAPVFLLWMTLVGALGMLLQSVVRERANRALEHLLASARPAEIVFGKMLGVGAVSMLVLATWLGSGAAIAATPLGAAPHMLAGLSSPGALAYAGAVYVMAFLLYGSALVSIGAFAKDLPSAQNLSRPIFGLLVIIFFLAMGSAIGFGEQLAWLVWVPPFTPFMLLLAGEGALAPWQHAMAWMLMGACIMATTVVASRSLIISPRPLWGRSR